MLIYNLFIKIKLKTKIEQLITNLTYNNLIAIVKKIEKTNRYINQAILALEQQIQIMAIHTPYSYAHYFHFRL